MGDHLKTLGALAAEGVGLPAIVPGLLASALHATIADPDEYLFSRWANGDDLAPHELAELREILAVARITGWADVLGERIRTRRRVARQRRAREPHCRRCLPW